MYDSTETVHQKFECENLNESPKLSKNISEIIKWPYGIMYVNPNIPNIIGLYFSF